ncbi:hypothetical protein D3C84_65560 [compost metagenome]
MRLLTRRDHRTVAEVRTCAVDQLPRYTRLLEYHLRLEGLVVIVEVLECADNATFLDRLSQLRLILGSLTVVDPDQDVRGVNRRHHLGVSRDSVVGVLFDEPETRREWQVIRERPVEVLLQEAHDLSTLTGRCRGTDQPSLKQRYQDGLVVLDKVVVATGDFQLIQLAHLVGCQGRGCRVARVTKVLQDIEVRMRQVLRENPPHCKVDEFLNTRRTLDPQESLQWLLGDRHDQAQTVITADAVIVHAVDVSTVTARRVIQRVPVEAGINQVVQLETVCLKIDVEVVHQDRWMRLMHEHGVVTHHA